ncbi:MAG: hypothetical protein AB8H80_12805 [Planctomycetota bacterium]
MTPTQFSLFFVALLIGYVLVHLRLVRFEEHLQKLAGIRSLDERLSSLDDRLQKLAGKVGTAGIDRISAQLERLHEDLEDLREATGEVRHAVVQIPAMPPAVGAVGGAAGELFDDRNGDRHADVPRSSAASQAHRYEPPATRIVALIETRLLQLGYRNLQLLGDMQGVEMTDEIEVGVEADKNGMPCKGRVMVRNGSIYDVHMQSVVQAFP